MKRDIVKNIKANSGYIYLGIGIATSILSYFLVARDTRKAINKKIKQDKKRVVDTSDIISEWKSYIPSATVASISIICLLASGIALKKREKEIVGAYLIVAKAFDEYRKKVKNIGGNDYKKLEISSAISNEKDFTAAIDGELYFDEYSGKIFECSYKEFLEGIMLLNRTMANEGECSLAMFLHNFLGVKDISNTLSTIGWDTNTVFEINETVWVDVWTEKVIMDDGLEVNYICYSACPEYAFDRPF